jgi:hypothetical protein
VSAAARCQKSAPPTRPSNHGRPPQHHAQQATTGHGSDSNHNDKNRAEHYCVLLEKAFPGWNNRRVSGTVFLNENNVLLNSVRHGTCHQRVRADPHFFAGFSRFGMKAAA